MQGESGRHVEPVSLIVIHFGKQFFAFLHDDVTRCASAVSSAGVVEEKVVVHGHVENRLGLAVIGIRQLPLFELEGLVRGHEGHANGIRARLFHGCRSLAAGFAFLVRHNLVSLYRLCSNSAGAIGCGADGPSPKSESAPDIVLPLMASETAESIMSSARRIVPSFKASIAARTVL